jgi:hypothetical protein
VVVSVTAASGENKLRIGRRDSGPAPAGLHMIAHGRGPVQFDRPPDKVRAELQMVLPARLDHNRRSVQLLVRESRAGGRGLDDTARRAHFIGNRDGQAQAGTCPVGTGRISVPAFGR